MSEIFSIQNGNSEAAGLLAREERLKQIRAGVNPYNCCHPLPGNAPVFYGRETELQGILDVLRQPDKPGNAGLWGEPNIGKTSLLNQVRQALAPEENTTVIYTTCVDWPFDSPESFYHGLSWALRETLDQNPFLENGHGAEDLRAVLRSSGQRYVLLLDDFDALAMHPVFDGDFFHLLGELATDPEYRLGCVLSASMPPESLCRAGSLPGTTVCAALNRQYTLGLLEREEAKLLAREPMQLSQGCAYQRFHKILSEAGEHPGFLQLVMSEYWKAESRGGKVDDKAILALLTPYFLELWERRNEAERNVLLDSANGVEFSESAPLFRQLRQRGLLDREGLLFSRRFREVVLATADPGSTLGRLFSGLRQMFHPKDANRHFEDVYKNL